MDKDRQSPVGRNRYQVFWKPYYPNASLMLALIGRGNIADQKIPGDCSAVRRAFRGSQLGAGAVTQGLGFGFREFAKRGAVTVTFVIDVVDDGCHLFEVPPAIDGVVAEDNSGCGEQYGTVHVRRTESMAEGLG